MENRLFGTEIIRNSAQDAVYAVGNEFLNITGIGRVPDKTAKNLADRTAETIDAARDRMTNTGFGAAGLMLVLAGAILISSE